jgi:hypothetical protein
MKQASVLTLPFLQLLHPECSRFVTLGLESEIYPVIERLKNPLVEDVTTQLLFSFSLYGKVKAVLA